jgi:hypothetical protein
MVGVIKPLLVLVLASDPSFEQVLIIVILRHFHTFARRIVPRQVNAVNFIVVERLDQLGFFDRKAAVPDSFDTLVQFPVNTGTGNADETANAQIDAAGQFGVAVGAFLVGGQSLQLSHHIIGRLGNLATSGACWAASSG